MLPLFSRGKKDRVITIDTSRYEEDPLLFLPYFDGMYTIRNINPDTSDDLFYFIPEKNMVKGFLDASNGKTINLINGKQKLVKSICNSFYHSIIDDIAEIVNALTEYPDHELIIDTSDIEYGINGRISSWDYFDFFLHLLDKKSIKYKTVPLKRYDIVYIDNFRLVSFIYESGQAMDKLYNFFNEASTVPLDAPKRKVFVSRASAGERKFDNVDGLAYSNDSRIDSHDDLDNYFSELGFDVVRAEEFNSFQEQLDYFSSASVIASLTGSGLTNSIFMPPNGVMIEIVTPLVVSVPPPNRAKDVTKPFYVQEIHNFYKNLAFYKNHLYIGIQNETREFAKIKELIEKNSRLKGMLDG